MALEKELTLIVLTSFIFDSATETFSTSVPGGQAVKAERVLASPSGRTPNGPNPIDLSLRLDFKKKAAEG